MSIFDIFKKLEKERSGDSKRDVVHREQSAVNYIICGLGNPGSDYENTRHNCGFMVLDSIAEKNNCDIKKLKFKSLTGITTISGKKCLLMKPSTFMNKSGEAVRAAMDFYKIEAENVIIIFDDISQDVGRIRIRRGGSDGGHNGIKNIIYLTGKDSFPRIKIGIGNKPHKDYPLADWVLSKFKKDEGENLEKAIEFSVLAAELIVDGKIDEAMNKFNGKNIS